MHKKISIVIIVFYLLLLSVCPEDTTGIDPHVAYGLYFLKKYLFKREIWFSITSIYIVATWVIVFSKIVDMFNYINEHRWQRAYAIMVSYSSLMALLFWSPKHSLTLSIAISLSLILFPYLFPHRKIINPTKSKRGALWLLGKGGKILPVNAPELGAFIVGLPGSGKTKFVIEPLLYRLISSGYTGILYDYDFSSEFMGSNYSLSHLAYHCCKNFTKGKTRFVSINFENLNATNRINPLSPDYIKDRELLDEILKSLLLNMSPDQKEDFWYKNTYALLKGLTVFFANKYPAQCTLPHIIIAGLQPVDKIIPLLKEDKEANLYASPVIDAYDNAPEQLAGVLANFKVSLNKLLNPSIFWILSGNDTPAVVNDPNNPTIVCLGNMPNKKAAYSPLLAMMVSFLSTNLYGHDREKSFVMVDELPTLYLPNLSEIPATARKYGVSTIVALQNMAQLETRYGNARALEIQETFSNHFIGKSPHKVAKEWSDRIGRKEVKSASHTTSSNQTSTTVHEKDKTVLTAQEVMDLGVGEFVGAISASDQPFFKMNLEAIDKYHRLLSYKHFKPLPTVTKEVDKDRNFEEIHESVKSIINNETRAPKYTF